MPFAYSFVGKPALLAEARARGATGVPWLSEREAFVEEGATFVVSLQGLLLLAPRRSEHVACAGGLEVLAAGELFFSRQAGRACLLRATNQSTGYCPDVDSWSALAHALAEVGAVRPAGFEPAFDFRRCEACGELSVVKERWFVCPFCDADLPQVWNVSARRLVEVA
jgi:hypothetical protein